MDLSIISDKNEFPELAKTRLAGISVNFARQMEIIDSRRHNGKPWQPAGVLIPICFKEELPGQDGGRGGFVIQLIRRSSKVVQGGDISGPGGMLSPRLDRLLRLPLALGMTPILREPARSYVRNKGSEEYDATTLFLANALRESWEELRLNPFNVDFLGPLPFHDLIMFTRTIFPLVGLVKKDQTYRPNSEVDRVVEIPLSAFFNERHYATYCVNNSHRPEITQFETPCLTWRSSDDEEDILWGATLRIIFDFLKIVLDFHPPLGVNGRIMTRTLSDDYMKSSGS